MADEPLLTEVQPVKSYTPKDRKKKINISVRQTKDLYSVL